MPQKSKMPQLVSVTNQFEGYKKQLVSKPHELLT